MNGLISTKSLRGRGVIGMNARNVSYIARYNERALYPHVDDKYETKKLAREHQLQTPPLYGLIRYQHQMKHLGEMLDPYGSFVIKPAKGSEGKGILIIRGRSEKGYLKPNGEILSLRDLKRHVGNILNGLYSLGGRTDKAMIEYAINFSDVFEGFSYQGVPDIRVIVFRGYPVMAMVRLSTKVSDGKANLHQGAVGVGVDLAFGHAIRAVQFNRLVEMHPDTGRRLSELAVSRWDELLLLAAQAFDMTGLGYVGVDIVLDKDRGPMVLELNARPGLAIQMASNAGLLPRLQRIEAIGKKYCSPSAVERIAFAKTHFA
ncbi:MAG: alpha-L-glutamate ligase-like protein [Verrucomicrobiota bacterium]